MVHEPNRVIATKEAEELSAPDAVLPSSASKAKPTTFTSYKKYPIVIDSDLTKRLLRELIQQRAFDSSISRGTTMMLDLGLTIDEWNELPEEFARHYPHSELEKAFMYAKTERIWNNLYSMPTTQLLVKYFSNKNKGKLFEKEGKEDLDSLMYYLIFAIGKYYEFGYDVVYDQISDQVEPLQDIQKYIAPGMSIDFKKVVTRFHADYAGLDDRDLVKRLRADYEKYRNNEKALKKEMDKSTEHLNTHGVIRTESAGHGMTS